MNCTLCGKPITLVPSARERADRYGGKPADYTRLFRQHAECLIESRREVVIPVPQYINYVNIL